MEFKVKISPFAITQLEETVRYISEVLLVPDTALKWLNRLEKEISSLSLMPARYPLTEEEPWKTKGIRKTFVKGFVIYYLINEEDKVVTVTAVVYGKRNQLAALKEVDD